MYYFIDNVGLQSIEYGILYSSEEIISIVNNKLNKNIKTIKELQYINEFRDSKYIKFTSNTDYKNNKYNYLSKLAETDGAINFNNLIGKIPGYKLKELISIQKSFNYSHIYLNRIVDLENKQIYFGCVIHSLGNIYGIRNKIPYNNFVDELPFIAYKKLLIYLKDIKKDIRINRIILGYDFDQNKLNIGTSESNYDVEVIKELPNNPGVEFERMSLYNLYIEKGKKLLPIQEIR